MKKTYLIILISTLTHFTYSQDISYGVLLGGNFYQSDNNNGGNQLVTENNKFISTLNLGVYFEYGINDNIGIKSELTLNKKKVIYHKFDIDFEFEFIEFSPSFKYDFGVDYKKGFYMTLGPRFSLISKTKYDYEDVFEKLNIGIQLGLGHRLMRFIDFQAKIDYGITPYFKLDNGNKSKFFGAYLSLFIDLSELINY